MRSVRSVGSESRRVRFSDLPTFRPSDLPTSRPERAALLPPPVAAETNLAAHRAHAEWPGRRRLCPPDARGHGPYRARRARRLGAADRSPRSPRRRASLRWRLDREAERAASCAASGHPSALPCDRSPRAGWCPLLQREAVRPARGSGWSFRPATGTALSAAEWAGRGGVLHRA